MKNRLSNLSKPSSRLLCLLAACGLAYSCTDEYTLDDEKPANLSTSIYQGLVNKGVYSTYLNLLSDKDVNTGSRSLIDVLNRTGSKTVFVASDEAYQTFFRENANLPKTNPWHYATSYAKLSPSQKKLIIHCSMLNNAIVMENLASSEATGSGRPVRGEYLRRFTDVALTDTISQLDATQIPMHYNTTDKDYWVRFRRPTDKHANGHIYLVNDATSSMMIHFTNEQMKKVGITDEDFAIIMGTPRNTEDVHVYDSKISSTGKDIACENGYINQMARVIKPLPNMAETIRLNGKTDIFSHILDRFSAPFYSPTVTQAYRDLNPTTFGDNDSIFSKNYFSLLSTGGKARTADPDGETFRDEHGEVALKFDPGWNEYYNEVTSERDMAAMFIPSDEAMREYFSANGAGRILLNTYCTNPGPDAPDATLEDLFKKIDQIPMSTLQALVNNIMFKTFNGSVPSKMPMLQNDAQEEIFTSDDVNKIDTVLLACNGAVYVMDKVYGPADYTSVAAPAYISKDNLVMKWAIYNGANLSTENPDYMGLNYYAYLKAMKSRFSMFLPSDEALKYYYDPLSLKVRTARVIEFKYENEDFPIGVEVYGYNKTTGVKGRKNSTGDVAQGEIPNRLKDILESHTIVHDSNQPWFENLANEENEYFLTKNGSAIKVTREQGKIVKVQGGFQLENEVAGITDGSLGSSACNVLQPILEQDNGRTLLLDAPIIPTSKSVHDIISNVDARYDEFEEFYKLTMADDEIITKCGLVDETELSKTEQAREILKYTIFANTEGTNNFSVGSNVSFFNNYRYTILVPSNEAVLEAIANGLPTWEDIIADFQSCMDPETEQLTTLEDSIRIQAKITYLTNFVRTHFADDSFFADKSETSEKEFVTSSFDNNEGVFVKIKMWRTKAGGSTILHAQDSYNGAVLTVQPTCNIMARDIFTNKKITSETRTMNNVQINGSSFAVIHGINGILNHTTLKNGNHADTWATTGEAKRYLKKYRIR